MVTYDMNWFLKRTKEVRPKDYNDYMFSGTYVNAHTYLNVKHLICGHEYKIIPNAFLRGRSCPQCAKKHRAHAQMKTTAEFQKELPSNLQVKSEYKGALRPILLHCTLCKDTFEVIPHSILKYKHCTHCGNHYRRTTEFFKKELKELVGNEYSLIGKYTKANSLIKVRHNKCGFVYMVTPHNFKHGKRCPSCNQPKGERLIEKALKELKVAYEPQKRFSDLVLKQQLSYDFYIPNSNLLIEYQGIQHYQAVKIFGGNDTLRIQLKRDKVKQEYAFENKYNLLKIPYKINQYEDIKELIKLNL